MASTTINVNAKAYRRLKQAKPPGKSFSDVILEYVRPHGLTAGDLLADLEPLEGGNFIDEALMRRVKARKQKKCLRFKNADPKPVSP